MTDTNPTLTVRYAVRCDPGHGRDSNEDVAYASGLLVAVADGTRGAGASTAAVNALKLFELADEPAVDLLAMLARGAPVRLARSEAFDSWPVLPRCVDCGRSS